MLNQKLAEWLRKDRVSKKMCVFLLFVIAIALLIIRLSQDNVGSESDLKYIHGRLEEYQFTDGSRGFHDYIIWLEGLSTPFQVSADFLNLFKKKDFQKLQYGDSLMVGVSKNGYDLVQKSFPKKVFVYSISSKTNNFLDGKKAIKKYNSPLMFFGCAFFFLWGGVLAYLLYETKKRS